jgi:hypothetical protein
VERDERWGPGMILNTMEIKEDTKEDIYQDRVMLREHGIPALVE